MISRLPRLLWDVLMRVWLGTCLLLSVSLGCQGNPSPLAPVAGKVAYRGYPVRGGTIVFTPDASRGHRGAMALGTIAADGTYTLRTGDMPGASAGWYRVTVASLSTSFNGSSAPQSMLPDKYRDPELSKLACEVKPKHPNTIDFNLD